MAEIWTKLKLKAFKEGEYEFLSGYIKAYLDDEGHWPVENYDDDNFAIEIKEVLAREEEAIGLMKLLDTNFKELADGQESEVVKEVLYKMELLLEGTTHFYSSGEKISYKIERIDGVITVQETPNYMVYSRDGLEDYEDFCEELECLDYSLEEIPSEEEFEKTEVFYVTYDKVYIDTLPEYGKKVIAR